jgi:5S rRNA maturation endonuclease (ribonuclease M5)
MTSVRFQKIEAALKDAGCTFTTRGHSIQSQCPAHDDDNPSLSIKENKDGKILINCHAGCHTQHILEALGFNFEILFPQDSRKNGQGRIVAEYDYTDENGKLLFQAVRFHPKSFRQRKPKAGGGWSWSLKGVRRVLYNLPSVQKNINAGKPVFLVEGEKDAEALIKRGICATTSPMGAEKWKSQYNDSLKAAELIILSDNDLPGKKHAVHITQQLLETAKSIRVLLLPDLKTKEDVSDWLAGGGTGEELLEMAFDCDPVDDVATAEALLDINTELDGNDPRGVKDLFFEDSLKVYSNDQEERVVADFNIDIKSIVKDDREGQIFYIRIRELDRGRPRLSDTIEIKPEFLDDLRSFYKAIRPFSMGEILQYRSYKTKPLALFKWLLQNFDKPIVRRPDHVGFTKGSGGRPFWLFGNAVICPPWQDNQAKIIHPNQSDEFIVNEKLGFTLPLYDSEAEKEQLAPSVNTNLANINAFLGEVKAKIIELIGGGDPTGEAKNYGKLLLAYVIYHLYEEDLYYANDINGHTIIFYVFGPKGTGKTTYFNTILRAFFGLEQTKDIKGNTVSVPGIENIMSMYSRLPVCYDEFNPEAANVSYQHINGYYHKTARSVSDTDRKNRNKFTHIRSSFSITSNYRINLDVDQADATESRTIYFQYKKEYRSDDSDLFEWMKNHLHQLSAITVSLLMGQTDQKRKTVKKESKKLFHSMRSALKTQISKTPRKYVEEHRLTDNYTRLLACYELIFGQDDDLRGFIKKELLRRFANAKSNQKENALLNQLIFLASSGRLKECWHYHYSNKQKELYVDISQCYQSYEAYRREKAVSLSQFREILKDYFEDCGGFERESKRWHGRYYNNDHNPVDVYKVQHSYILTYEQVNQPDNLLSDLFPPQDEHREKLRRLKNDETTEEATLVDQAPF